MSKAGTTPEWRRYQAFDGAVFLPPLYVIL
jgi:hypothetical protein